MATIYRLDASTLFLCEDCLDSHGPVPGTWREAELDSCSICGESDLQAQEEMHQLCAEMDQQSWEEDQMPEDYNPQKSDIWEYK